MSDIRGLKETNSTNIYIENILNYDLHKPRQEKHTSFFTYRNIKKIFEASGRPALVSLRCDKEENHESCSSVGVNVHAVLFMQTISNLLAIIKFEIPKPVARHYRFITSYQR